MSGDSEQEIDMNKCAILDNVCSSQVYGEKSLDSIHIFYKIRMARA